MEKLKHRTGWDWLPRFVRSIVPLTIVAVTYSGLSLRTVIVALLVVAGLVIASPVILIAGVVVVAEIAREEVSAWWSRQLAEGKRIISPNDQVSIGGAGGKP